MFVYLKLTLNIVIRKITYVVSLCASDLVLWKVSVHLISIKVSVVGLAVGVVETQRLLACEHPRLYTHAGNGD